MPTEPRATIFVYGTLRRGGSNHHRMQGATWIADATVRGRLFQVSWYPAMVLDPTGHPIIGQIYQVTPNQLAALDDYEGPEYRRVRTSALNHHGEPIEVDVWEWTQAINDLKPIAHGDWLRADA